MCFPTDSIQAKVFSTVPHAICSAVCYLLEPQSITANGLPSLCFVATRPYAHVQGIEAIGRINQVMIPKVGCRHQVLSSKQMYMLPFQNAQKQMRTSEVQSSFNLIHVALQRIHEHHFVSYLVLKGCFWLLLVLFACCLMTISRVYKFRHNLHRELNQEWTALAAGLSPSEVIALLETRVPPPWPAANEESQSPTGSGLTDPALFSSSSLTPELRPVQNSPREELMSEFEEPRETLFVSSEEVWHQVDDKGDQSTDMQQVNAELQFAQPS